MYLVGRHDQSACMNTSFSLCVTYLTTWIRTSQFLFSPFLSGNRTTGSWCNLLVGQAHPSESCQILTLTLWIPGQTLIATTSTASFIQNPVFNSLVCASLELSNRLSFDLSLGWALGLTYHRHSSQTLAIHGHLCNMQLCSDCAELTLTVVQQLALHVCFIVEQSSCSWSIIM